MNISQAFEILFAHFHSHSNAAIYLGYTRDHYRALRNGRTPISLRAANFIILKASELEPTPGDAGKEASHDLA